MSHDLTQAELRHLISDRDSLNRDDFFFLRLHIVPSPGLTLEQAAIKVLLILTGRTMQRLPYETARIRSATSGFVVELDPNSNIVELALPTFLCEPHEGLTHLMTLVSSAAEYNYCDEYWLDNVEFPPGYVAKFPGPRFGVPGIRGLFGPGATDRPLVGVIFKPRKDVPPADVLQFVSAALMGGCDFVADDLLLVDPAGPYSLEQRVPMVVDLIRRLNIHNGFRKAYFVNVGTNCGRAVVAGQKAIEAGATGLIANAFTMGFGSFSEFVDALEGRAPIITSNMGGGILTRPRLLNKAGKPTGLSETVVSKFSRLAGADGVHAGTSASECYGTDAWGPATRALNHKFYDLKSCFAVAEGDLNLTNIWENIKSLGRDLLLEPTSGILAAPGGPLNAARVFRDLAERLTDDMKEEEANGVIGDYASKHAHLGVKKMLDHFGFRRVHGRQ